MQQHAAIMFNICGKHLNILKKVQFTIVYMKAKTHLASVTFSTAYSKAVVTIRLRYKLELRVR